MPTSASRKPSADLSPPRRRFLLPLIAITVIAALAVVIIALPASVLARYLPPALQAGDFSGSIWHGSAGTLVLNGRPAGAIEWHIHPASLLALTLAADVHWVKGGFLTDAGIVVDRVGLTAREVQGGGPIEDLADFGIAAGWHGTARLVFSELKLLFTQGPPDVVAAIGEIDVAHLASPQLAAGADLGGYSLRLAAGAITPDADPGAELNDTGGPLELRAVIHFSPKDHTGLLSGTLKERAGAPEALRRQLEQLGQLHARDAEGRLPVDLEFSF